MTGEARDLFDFAQGDVEDWSIEMVDGRRGEFYWICPGCNAAVLTPIRECEHWARCSVSGSTHDWQPDRGGVVCRACGAPLWTLALDVDPDTLTRTYERIIKAVRSLRDPRYRRKRQTHEAEQRKKQAARAKGKRARKARKGKKR